jgi:diacylglycerol O-acyltransferase
VVRRGQPAHDWTVPAEVHRLTLTDLTNLAVEGPDTPMHQGAIAVLDGESLLDLDGRIRIERIRTSVALRLDRIPELRRNLFQTGPLQGRPLWVDDPSFRIENHVLVATLPAPGGEKPALRFAEQQMSGLMDRTRPLWELWFLEGYGVGKVGLFLKVHHALADGPAILNMLGQLSDLDAELVVGSASTWEPQIPPSPRELIFDNLLRKGRFLAVAGIRLAHPYASMKDLMATARGIWEAIKEGRGAPHTSLNRAIGAERRVGVIHLSLEEVKVVAHRNDATVNDVFLAVIAAGLRDVLLARGQLVGDLQIHASMAVSLHAKGDQASVGNHVGTMIVRLGIGVADSMTRLATIASNTRIAKARQRATVPQALMVLLAITGLTRFFIRRQHLVNVLVTNLHGPEFPLYIAGARILDAFAIPPIAGNVTVSFAALSYSGHFDVSVHADAEAWPDLEVLIAGIRCAWLELIEREVMSA